jgi:hypothetical protein
MLSNLSALVVSIFGTQSAAYSTSSADLVDQIGPELILVLGFKV